MAEVIFEDNTIKLKEDMSERIAIGLEEAAGELESQVKRNTRVDTGQTKNSWQHNVTGSMMAGQHVATVGSPLENAIYEEFGTGEYALKGDGRKDGWNYQDEEGVWHHTIGKKPSRALHNAVTTKKATLIKLVTDKLQGL
jgi:hypothetical protein